MATLRQRIRQVPGYSRARAWLAGDRFSAEIAELLSRSGDLEARCGQAEAALEEVRAERARWRELEDNLPRLLHALSVSTGSLRRLRREVTDLEGSSTELEATAARLGDSVEELWQRSQMVRAEVLHEIRHRTVSVPQEAGESKVVDPEHVESLRREGPFRLNLGCGHLALEGYVNVDMRPLPGVDVVARLDDIPFEVGTVDEIFSAHVLEHFTLVDLRRELLPHWFELLRPGGEFRAVVPDADAMARGLVDGSVSFEDYAAVLMGGQEYDGDFHFSVFTPESMCELLSSAGFDDARVQARGRPLDVCLELEVSSRRPR
jgi:SAM-dependent methyltransferase